MWVGAGTVTAIGQLGKPRLREGMEIVTGHTTRQQHCWEQDESPYLLSVASEKESPHTPHSWANFAAEARGLRPSYFLFLGLDVCTCQQTKEKACSQLPGGK